MREAVHNALMDGLKRAGIRYESDGATYWVDFDGGALYVEIGRCEE